MTYRLLDNKKQLIKFVSNNRKNFHKMGNNRLIFNRNVTTFNSKCGVASVCIVSKNNSYTHSVKSQLVKRSSDDLKRSRVSAYSYLIP